MPQADTQESPLLEPQLVKANNLFLLVPPDMACGPEVPHRAPASKCVPAQTGLQGTIHLSVTFLELFPVPLGHLGLHAQAPGSAGQSG